MQQAQRPLSPHLGIYQFGWTMIFSFTHRMTGFGLAFGMVGVVIWLSALAMGPTWYEFVEFLLIHPLGQLVFWAFAWALLFHLCNGCRHLIWDSGAMMELGPARYSGYVVYGLSVILSLVVLWYGPLTAPGGFFDSMTPFQAMDSISAMLTGTG